MKSVLFLAAGFVAGYVVAQRLAQGGVVGYPGSWKGIGAYLSGQ